MTSDVLGVFLTYPNQILYYISLFSKISDVICECSLKECLYRGISLFSALLRFVVVSLVCSG